MNVKQPLTRRQKFHNKLPLHLRTKVQEVEKRKPSIPYKQQNLYPSFPLSKKYQLILVDYPIKYESTQYLAPPYLVLTMDELKRLPIEQIADQDCVLLSWASGITLDKVLDLKREFKFKHFTMFHVWRKTQQDGTLYTSKTLKAQTTTPSYEVLLMGIKGNWKKLLQPNKEIVLQELQAPVREHSVKPSQIYETIKKVFRVYEINCLELFAQINKHPYFDLYGNMVQNFFQPSLKVVKQNSFVNNKGYVQLDSFNSIKEKTNDALEQIINQLLNGAQLNKEEMENARNLIKRNKQAFALSEYEVGEIQELEFPIDLIPGAEPFAQQPYRLSDKEKKIMQEQIENWEKLKYIKRKNTEWASPAFLIPKGNGKYRVCTDFRYLNAFTIPNHSPIPNMSDFFGYLFGKVYMSKFDLKSSYQNMRIREQDQNKTAFTTFLGTFICLRMLFGQKNSASYFQMAIENILRPLLYKNTLVYIDDVIVFSEDKEQHFKDLEEVLQLLIKGNVKLHPEKSSIFMTEIEFLGHTIKDGKYQPRPKKYGILKNMQSPQNKTQLKSFLGLVGFYRKFVPNFAMTSKPLNELLKKDIKFVWSQTEESAFRDLQAKILELPSLHLPNNSKTYYLSTDFCIDGIGAVIAQRDEQNNEYPIEFASRNLNQHEAKYGSYEGEILAVVWALQKFRHLLINNQFVLFTDNKALSQVLQKGNPSLKLQRWLQVLNDFSFLVIHRTSRQNINADALSRLNPLIQNNPNNVCTDFIQSIEPPTYEPIDLPDIACKTCGSKEAKDMLLCELCGMGHHTYCVKDRPKEVPSDFYYCNKCMERISKGEVKDIVLDFNVLNYVKEKTIPQDANERQRVIKRAKNLAYDFEKGRFLIQINKEFKEIPTLLERRQIIQQNHDNSAHTGVLKTCSLILQRYFWRNMQQWVKTHISKCALCIANKSTYQKQVEYIPVPKGKEPCQFWAIDLATNLPKTKEGYQHLLVMVDPFSKWTVLIPLKSKESQEVTFAIHANIISQFGLPIGFRSDRGTEFRGLFDDYCKILGIAHYRTYPNHPQGNGQAESLVGFSIELIKKTLHQRRLYLNQWNICIPTVLYTLRFSNCVSKLPPFEVLFGRKPSVISPLDFQPKHIDFKVNDTQVEEYAKKLAESQKHLFPRIKKQLEELDEHRMQKHQDKYTNEPKALEPNQMVFRNSGQRTTKLQLTGQGPYVFKEFKGKTGAIIQDPVNSKLYEVNKYDIVAIPKLGEEDPMDLQPHIDPNNEQKGEITQIPQTRGRPTRSQRFVEKTKKSVGRPKRSMIIKRSVGRPKRS